MKRELTIRRLYKTGQFENLEFTDTVSEIPDDLAFDDSYIKNLSNVMMLRLEAQWNRYISLRETTRDKEPQEVFTMLEDLANEKTQLLTQTKKEI